MYGTTKQCNILNIQALASVVLEKTFPIISLYGRYLFVWTTKHCYIHNIEALGLFSQCKSMKGDLGSWRVLLSYKLT